MLLRRSSCRLGHVFAGPLLACHAASVVILAGVSTRRLLYVT